MAEQWLIGIDPGLKGGLARIDLTTGRAHCWATPLIRGTPKRRGPRGGIIAAIKDECDGLEMAKLIPEGSRVYIERVGAMPHQGVTSMFRFGFATALWHGICGARGIVPQLVAPQTWKALYGLHEEKNASREKASEIAPKLAGLWPLVKHDGIAESFLIAHWALLQIDSQTKFNYELDSAPG